MARVFTHQDVHDVLQANWENTELADKVIAALRRHEGKILSKAILKSLPEVPGGWRIRRQYGMTHLETDDYARNNFSNKTAIGLLLAHREENVYINCADVEERNPAYFSAAKERNHTRMEAMNTKAVLDGAAEAMTAVHAALESLDKAMESLKHYTDYGQPLSHDRYSIERLVGLRDDKGERVRL